MKALILGFAFLTLFLGGCVQQPTTSEVTVDLRPAIAFTPAFENQNTTVLRIFVDHLDMGTADQFLSGEAALRVLAGSHLLQIKRDGETLLSTTFYLGDGAIKNITLPK